MAGCSISSAIIRRWFWRTATASLVLRKPPNCRSTRLAASQPYSHHPAACCPAPVLCYDGYLTPQNPQNQQHCIGASYHRGKTDTTFSEEDQQHNRQRLIDCFPGAEWPQDVDISANDARCGVRCATRDHLPMVGNVPDYAATLTQYASLHEQPDIADSAPVCRNLFMLGALGSRGLCTAPLSAELLAAQMSAEPLPLDSDTGGAESESAVGEKTAEGKSGEIKP